MEAFLPGIVWLHHQEHQTTFRSPCLSGRKQRSDSTSKQTRGAGIGLQQLVRLSLVKRPQQSKGLVVLRLRCSLKKCCPSEFEVLVLLIIANLVVASLFKEGEATSSTQKILLINVF
jgi:hypothetical protein